MTRRPSWMASLPMQPVSGAAAGGRPKGLRPGARSGAVAHQPGDERGRGVAVGALDWPDVVRDGDARFRLSLSRGKNGPERIRAHIEPAFGGHVGVGEPVEVSGTSVSRALRMNKQTNCAIA